MYLHEPTRGGTRGGKDQFTWKNVEVDKYRENYLANSLMAPVGRWQKGKDLTWYTKDSKVLGKKEKLQLERETIKKAEADAMARALGLTPSSSVKPVEKLTNEEIAEVCKRRNDEDEEILPEVKMKGFGYKNSRSVFTDLSSASKDGITKFEQDTSTDKAGKLVLAHSRKRTISATSVTSEIPKQIAATESTDMKEIWVPADAPSVSCKKDSEFDRHKKKRKKHSSEKSKKRRKHSDQSEDKYKKYKHKKHGSSLSKSQDRHSGLHKPKRTKKS